VPGEAAERRYNDLRRGQAERRRHALGRHPAVHVHGVRPRGQGAPQPAVDAEKARLVRAVVVNGPEQAAALREEDVQPAEERVRFGGVRGLAVPAR